MQILTREEALKKRAELIELGYTSVSGLMEPGLLAELRTWSDDVFQRLPVDPKLRYQGSDLHVYTERKWEQMEAAADERRFPDPIVAKVIDQPRQMAVCRELGLEDLTAHDVIILLSKPAFGPPLYWHQDYMNWNSPASATPWPTVIFLSYYMTDTTRANGCLRVIPGSHRRRLDLHDSIPDAHGPEIQSIDDRGNHPAFADRDDAVDLPLKAGDLVIADARLMHGAWPNQTDRRRTLVLAWHTVFPFPRPPSWWADEIPDVVAEADPAAAYEGTRTPGAFLE